MKLFLKTFVAALLVLAFVAPAFNGLHCEGDEDTDCSTECACICCCAPVLTSLEQAGWLAAFSAEYSGAVDTPFPGRLPPADIFRPPTSA